MKDTDTQTGDEVHWARPGAVLSAGASVPVGSGCGVIPFLGWTCSPVWSSPGILWRHLHVDVISYCVSGPSPLSGEWGQESGGGGLWKFQPSNPVLVVPVTSPHPGAHPESPAGNKRHSCHPGIYKGFRSSVWGTMSETKYYIKQGAPSVLIT